MASFTGRRQARASLLAWRGDGCSTRSGLRPFLELDLASVGIDELPALPALPARQSRRPPRAPRWAQQATAVLADASRHVRVIAACTPVNLREELSRLRSSWARGPRAPRFVYEPPPDHVRLRAFLEGMRNELGKHGPLGEIFAARATEMCDDAAICELAGGAGVWPAARRRYAARDRFDAEADGLADAWLAGGPAEGLAEGVAECDAQPVEAEAPVRSDDEASPRSLVSRLRQELGKRRLPMRVVVRENLASLAATGDGLVQVAAGHALRARDVERTVLHEIAGHVEPRVIASSARLGIFVIGTARGSDDQEGRALHLERASGFLDLPRRRELALRHVAGRHVEARGDFVGTVRLLLDRGAPLEGALRIAARAHRGGGLAREVVYLPALLRVEAAIASDPSLDRVLAAGRISVDAAPELAAWIDG
jgi:hypothetical protein